MKSIIFTTFLILSITTIGFAQINYQGPESVVYDSINNRYLITSSNSNEIYSIDMFSGNDSVFANLNLCMGNDIMGEIMFVTSEEKLYAYNIINNTFLWEMTISGASFLDGIAHDPDGNLYLVDVLNKKIFKVDPVNMQSEIFVSTLPFSSPQDIVYDHIQNRLILVAWTAYSAVAEINITTSEVAIIENCTSKRLDGVAMDNEGNFYLSSHTSGGHIAKYNNDFSAGPEILSTGHNVPAGLCVDQINSLIVIPNYGGNTVDFLSTINRMDGIEDIVYDEQEDSYFITNALGGDIIRVDSRGNQFLVAGGYTYPMGIILDEEMLLYATNPQHDNSNDSAEIICINKNTFEQYFCLKIAEAVSLSQMDQNPITGLIYIADQSGKVFEIDKSSLEYQLFADNSSGLVNGTQSVTIDTANNRLIVFSWPNTQIKSIDIETQDVENIGNAGTSQNLSSTNDNHENVLFSSWMDNKIHIIDKNMNYDAVEISGTLSEPTGFCIKAGYDSLIVCNYLTNNLYSIKLHYIDTIISSGQVIEFYSQVIDTSGIYSHIIESANYSDTYLLFVTMEGISGIETGDNSKTDIINFSPNPCLDLLKIELQNTTDCYLQLVNIAGQEFFSKRVQKSIEIIDIKNYPPGLYILKAVSGERQKSYKILLNYSSFAPKKH